jgi:predicted nuclease of predicted toxin-antitoxin system
VRLLADQDLWMTTVVALRTAGHDVLRVSEIGLDRATDAEILSRAKADERVVVTRDLDFGRLVVGSSDRQTPVIIVRASPALADSAHAVLLQVLASYEPSALPAVVVVEPGRYRVHRRDD